MRVSSGPMPACPRCGAQRPTSERSCPSCGAAGAVSPAAAVAASAAGGHKGLALELDLPTRPPPPPPRAPSEGPDSRDVTIDLAFDPRAAVAAKPQGAIVVAESGAVVLRSAPPSGRDSSSRGLDPTLYDVDADARLLAEYGPAPTTWLGMGFYWWRVVKRRRELKVALA